MSLSLFFVVAAGAALGGYLAGRAAKRRHALDAARATPQSDAPWGEGDVLSLPGGDDVVLAREERFVRASTDVARLYTPDVGPVIVLLPPPDATVLELEPVDLDLPVPPPSTIEIEHRTFERRSLITLDDEREAQIADYAADDRAAFVIVDGAAPTRVYAGRRHEARDVERLPTR